jgi:hypothetical protein
MDVRSDWAIIRSFAGKSNRAYTGGGGPARTPALHNPRNTAPGTIATVRGDAHRVATLAIGALEGAPRPVRPLRLVQDDARRTTSTALRPARSWTLTQEAGNQNPCREPAGGFPVQPASKRRWATG